MNRGNNKPMFLFPDVYLLIDIPEMKGYECWEYYDGPILGSCINSSGEKYSYAWSDVGRYYHRWVYLTLSNKQELDLKENRLDYYGFFIDHEFAIIIDIGGDISPKRGWEVPFSKLPESYIPTKDCGYLDFEGEEW
jgi:hypothetical protein